MTESFDDTQVPELEYDETIPPRPEEEVADAARAVPDAAGHGGDGARQAVPADPDEPTAREVG
ncbi:hypothetical protein J1G42_07990 [Cellulomonas sp. zg-ZUI222]|uniref:Uncharacterized protein n=1 Tax=Cellulomonas wangleii TaxID=2816956 RepID=A0ABX8CZY5_9CELL|nr:MULTISPECIES: hypothetical protein [Cellulomonas]MBO0900320.1 hypothetical protein [Cellulomonas sp. zg-ZUI22]MBO0920766.1 hypothetical protein [Cellulomonas wangleii]MBO0926639.1 hypothetical protein [Cellulomonas wangleii]QVI60808.1 hypothetical protein KG103_09550 [Cellulomonas wangleii]